MQIRKLNKVLNEIEKLKAQVDSGEITPDGNQSTKLAKQEGILAEIAVLEASD